MKSSIKVILSSLIVIIPSLAFAQAPEIGIVVEGSSAPGVALGDTRAEVDSAYGQPMTCQSGLVPGDDSFCGYPIVGGGQVFISFDGTGINSDKVARITWTVGANSWFTTENVNMHLVLTSPESVVAAYPNAEVFENGSTIFRIVDNQRGIEVTRRFVFRSGGDISGDMSIFVPTPDSGNDSGEGGSGDQPEEKGSPKGKGKAKGKGKKSK